MRATARVAPTECMAYIEIVGDAALGVPWFIVRFRRDDVGIVPYKTWDIRTNSQQAAVDNNRRT